MLYLPPWSLTSTVDDSVKIQLKSTKCNSSFIYSNLRPSFVRDFGLNTGSQLINICKCYQPNDFAKRVIYQVLLNWYCSPCLVYRLNSSPIIFCLLTTTFSSLFRVVMFFTHWHRSWVIMMPLCLPGLYSQCSHRDSYVDQLDRLHLKQCWFCSDLHKTAKMWNLSNTVFGTPEI